MSSENSNTFLRVEDLRKSFGGVQALEGLSFTVTSGIIKAIIGPNGAGKTERSLSPADPANVTRDTRFGRPHVTMT